MPSILIVEDNEMNRDMLSRRLARRGFDVLVAEDGPQGLAVARERTPSLDPARSEPARAGRLGSGAPAQGGRR